MAEKHLTNPGVNFTPYHQEETLERGGAAVMRMILGSDKVNLSPLPTQLTLYSDAITRNRAGEPAGLWYIDPQGLRDSLMHFKPAAFTNNFVNYNFAAGDQAAANAKIVYTIEVYEVAPAVLVAGGPQWVAVVGYRTSGAGALEAVFLNDPRPPISDGTGDPPDFEVNAATWNNAAGGYFRTVSGGVFWNNQFAMVCDPDEPKGKAPTAEQRPRADGRQIINPDQAIQFTREILHERGMDKRELFAHAVEHGTPAKPQLVQVLSGRDQYYYLVRYQTQGQDLAVVALDARFGVFLEAIAYHKPVRFFRVPPGKVASLLSEDLPIYERLRDAVDRILHTILQNVYPRRAGIIPGLEIQHLRDILEVELARSRVPFRHQTFRPEEIKVHDLMVWQPSGESISMLYPFYQAQTPTQRIYVRAADAGIFVDLSPFRWLRLGG